MRLVGAIAQHPGSAVRIARRAAALSVRGAATLVDTLHAEDQIAVFAIRRPEESLAAVITRSDIGRERFWFAGDTMTLPHATGMDAATSIDRLRDTLEGDYAGIAICGDGTVRVYNDSWGIGWLFLRRFEGGVVFGSDFRAVCTSVDAPLTVDADAMLLELAIGFVPDDRTIFREVTVVPPGGFATISSQGVIATVRHIYEYGDTWCGAPPMRKLERLDTLFEASARRTAALAGGRAAISLSAGHDSRLALAWLGRCNAVGPLLTFGEAQSDEVIDARAVAQSHSDPPDWSSFGVERADFDSWRSMIQSLGNAGIVQWCGWADAWMAHVRRHATNCTMGYLGDALSGKRLDVLASYGGSGTSADDWRRRWIAFELDMGEWEQSALLRPGARARLTAAAAEQFESLMQCVHITQPHQSAHHCNVVGRQRRWVGTQPVFMSAYVTPLSPFVDRAYREFWMNVGLDDLLGQALYHRYAEDRFPKLFPKAPSGAARLVRRIGRRLRRERDLIIHGRLPQRPSPIVRGKLLAGHFAEIRVQLDRLSSVLDDSIDVAGLLRGMAGAEQAIYTKELTSTMLFRLINVMHLLDLRTR